MVHGLKSVSTLPARHRVVACLGGSRTAIEHRPVPIPGRGEVLLRMRLSGLCGTDLFKLETGSVTAGMVLGHELVGEVAALGDEAPPFSLGERVVVPHHVPCGTCVFCRRGSETMCTEFRANLLEPGGFCEYILVRARAAALAAKSVPAGLADEAALYMEPAACVYRGVRQSGLPQDGFAVVQGAGSMGLLHVLVLRAAMPGLQIAVVDPMEQRRDLARKLGANHAAAPGAEAGSVIRSIAADGADAVFDTVGGPGPLSAALGLIRNGGSVILFAHAPEAALAGFDLNELFKHEKRVLGTYSGALREQEAVFQLLSSGRLDPTPLNTHRFGLEAFEEGVTLARQRRALKVLFENR